MNGIAETDTETAYVESEVDERYLLAMIALTLGLPDVAMVEVALYLQYMAWRREKQERQKQSERRRAAI